MEAKEKMSFGKKVAWILTVIFLAWIFVSGLIEGSVLVLFIFAIMVYSVIKHGPAGLLLFLIVASVFGVMGFLFSLMDSILSPGKEEWYLFIGCIVVGAICLFSILRWDLIKKEVPTAQTAA